MLLTHILFLQKAFLVDVMKIVNIYVSKIKPVVFSLLQAQRDYFGAHTYELLSNPGKFVHTNWTGLGGQVSASTYDA